MEYAIRCIQTSYRCQKGKMPTKLLGIASPSPELHSLQHTWAASLNAGLWKKSCQIGLGDADLQPRNRTLGCALLPQNRQCQHTLQAHQHSALIIKGCFRVCWQRVCTASWVVQTHHCSRMRHELVHIHHKWAQNCMHTIVNHDDEALEDDMCGGLKSAFQSS